MCTFKISLETFSLRNLYQAMKNYFIENISGYGEASQNKY